MNKRNVRSFAFGVLFSVSLLSASYLWLEQDASLDLKEAKEIVKKEGFIVVSKDEYEQLQVEDERDTKNAVEEEIEEKRNVELDKEQSELDPPPETSEDEPKNEVIQYRLEIQPGMNTRDISEMLLQEKIVEDASEFEQYLIDHDYNRRVQIGNFDLSNEMSYEEIGRIITKS